ncbi:hypothetical protein CLCR_05282 [Cladophialophora carrionii]|uniref:Uncharacterized protein n=1 Tax=Cladophialophora carrionii TaxID=86049 RepID=A0A1C1CJP1_9EURO|nr:hypothetical protein CLCR_05282 [Cladophialophora carrionii]
MAVSRDRIAMSRLVEGRKIAWFQSAECAMSMASIEFDLGPQIYARRSPSRGSSTMARNFAPLSVSSVPPIIAFWELTVLHSSWLAVGICAKELFQRVPLACATA